MLTVLPGAQSVEEIEFLLKYYEQPEEALDYSVIGSFAPPEASGKCVYCNHCQPCPVGIDIAAVNKFYDLAAVQDKVPESVREHYLSLAHTASECVACGGCEERCPFGVKVTERMEKAAELFK